MTEIPGAALKMKSKNLKSSSKVISDLLHQAFSLHESMIDLENAKGEVRADLISDMNYELYFLLFKDKCFHSYPKSLFG